MNIRIASLNENNLDDIRMGNEPFSLRGRLNASYLQGKWSYEVIPEKESSMTFPDEEYDYASMKDDHLFLGAYIDDECVGLAVLRKQWNKYLYLHDLKVKASCRGKGVGHRLIEASVEQAKKMGCIGLFTIAQDNNVDACLFYLHVGFHIGGIDEDVYKGTKQEGKKDIFFYLDALE